MRLKHSISLFTLLLMANVTNTSNSEVIENIIVSAAKEEQNLEDVISAAVILNEKDILESGLRSVSEVLQMVGGIDISRNGGVGQLTSIFMQGSNSNHVLLLIDGVAINDLATGISAVQNIPIDLIEKIEIIKSPRATLYGSNAIGGVVNIFTKKNSLRDSYSMTLGSDETKEISISKVIEGNSTDFGFSATVLDTDGYSSKVGSNLDDPHKNRSINAFAKKEFENFVVETSFWDSAGETSYKDFFLNPVSQDFHNSIMRFNLNHDLTKKWSYSLDAKYSKDFLDQNDSNDFNHSERTTIEWINRYQMNEYNKTLMGFVFEDEEFSASNYGSKVDEEFNNTAVFVEHLYSKSQHQALIAFRSGNSDFLEYKNSWNAEYGYKINPKLRLMILGGAAYRNPSAFDLFGFGGNTMLVPEKSKKIGLGFSMSTDKSTEFTMRFFDNKIDDLIVFSYADYKLYNIDQTQIRGIDLSVSTEINDWKVKLNSTIQDPKNLIDDSQLLRRPKKSFALTLGKTFDDLTLNVNLTKNSSRFDFGGLKLEAYTLINLSAQWRVNDQWMIHGSINNTFDEDYVLAYGYNTPKRKAYIGFNYMMN